MATDLNAGQVWAVVDLHTKDEQSEDEHQKEQDKVWLLGRLDAPVHHAGETETHTGHEVNMPVTSHEHDTAVFDGQHASSTYPCPNADARALTSARTPTSRGDRVSSVCVAVLAAASVSGCTPHTSRACQFADTS